MPLGVIWSRTGLGVVDTRHVVVVSGQFGMVWTVNLEVNRRGLLEQLNRFLKFPLPRSITTRWLLNSQVRVNSSSALGDSQVH